jgi:hypothetical protein
VSDQIRYKGVVAKDKVGRSEMKKGAEGWRKVKKGEDQRSIMKPLSYQQSCSLSPMKEVLVTFEIQGVRNDTK